VKISLQQINLLPKKYDCALGVVQEKAKKSAPAGAEASGFDTSSAALNKKNALAYINNQGAQY